MIKVFIVEDEIIIRESIHRMIPWADYGFEYVGEASDGEMALPMIRSLQPNLIITDIKMPFMDGLTLCRHVKEEFPETRVVIISGYDDFEYARQAISLGVEQYLLKPIRRVDFIEALEKIRTKFEAENEQKIYYEKFRMEIQEYEKNSRRDFFDMLISGDAGVDAIVRRAEQLEIDIAAQSYNLVFFSVESKEAQGAVAGNYSQTVADIHEQMMSMFAGSREYLLFRNQTFSYAVVVKGAPENIEELTKSCIEKLQGVFERYENNIKWAVCAGKSVDGLDGLRECYNEGMRIFAYRYMGYSHVLTQDNAPGGVQKTGDMEEDSIRGLDIGSVDPAIIKNFLCVAQENEVDAFIENYVKMVGERAFMSTMFRQYILLNIHFSSVAFVQMLGYGREKLDGSLDKVCNSIALSEQEVKDVIRTILVQGIRLREENARGKYQGIISKAIQFMENNFQDEKLTLNSVACATNVSPNHFSALFSQEMGQTFIEYLTGLRMKRAKELLRCTDKRSGEIAYEVGYNDSHYFSFLFKKTQGCTPSEYRNGRWRENEEG